jgi:hypothetical protein
MAQSPEEEERYWEEEAGMRERSELGRGFEASPTERNWAVATHLAGLAGYLVPFANIIAPLVIWLMKRDESEYIGWHACEALNFQISMLIYLAVATVLIWVLIGYLLLPLLALFNVVTVVLSALAASRGELRPYPLSLRLVS